MSFKRPPRTRPRDFDPGPDDLNSDTTGVTIRPASTVFPSALVGATNRSQSSRPSQQLATTAPETLTDGMPTLKRQRCAQESLIDHGHGAVEGVEGDLGRYRWEDGDYVHDQDRREQEERPRKRSRPLIMGLNDGYDYYTRTNRPFEGGPDYYQLSFNALRVSFPHVPTTHITQQLQRHRGLFAPTHLSLLNEKPRSRIGAKEEGERPSRNEGELEFHNPPQESKGKGRELACNSFYEEKRWLDNFLKEHPPRGRNAMQTVYDSLNNSDNHHNHTLPVECGCCFSEFLLASMVQCPNNHKFCQTCLETYAATELTTRRNPVLTCIDTSGCSLPFHDSELRRLLSPKLLSLYQRLTQMKALREANVRGLEECPFCPWACIIEDPIEQNVLFRCGNEEGECGIVSCRMCKKKNHWPDKTCKQAQEDEHLGGRVMIEEAMSKALIRVCPNPECGNQFIKENGCNKMKCPSCGTASCYVCRQVVTGYGHFHKNIPNRKGSSSKNTKCPMWDDNLDQRHQEEVREACEKALEEYKRDHPDAVFGKDIKVDCAAPGNKPSTSSSTFLIPPLRFPEPADQLRILRALQPSNNVQPAPYPPPQLIQGTGYAPPHAVAPLGGGMQHVGGYNGSVFGGAGIGAVQNPQILVRPVQEQYQNTNNIFGQGQRSTLLLQFAELQRLSNLHNQARNKVERATTELALARAQAAQAEQLLLRAREREARAQGDVDSGEREAADIRDRIQRIPQMMATVGNTYQVAQRGGFDAGGFRQEPFRDVLPGAPAPPPPYPNIQAQDVPGTVNPLHLHWHGSGNDIFGMHG